MAVPAASSATALLDLTIEPRQYQPLELHFPARIVDIDPDEPLAS
jgi:hypothetical protein